MPYGGSFCFSSRRCVSPLPLSSFRGLPLSNTEHPLTTSPALTGINAFVYMTVARMVHFGLPSQKIWGIRAARMTLLFVWLDIVCFLVQGGGGSMLSGDNSADVRRIGSKVYMSGVGLQLAFVLVFIVLTVCFYVEMRRVTGGRMGLMRWLTLAMIAVLLFIVVSNLDQPRLLLQLGERAREKDSEARIC